MLTLPFSTDAAWLPTFILNLLFYKEVFSILIFFFIIVALFSKNNINAEEVKR